jgi:hypothetical protein
MSGAPPAGIGTIILIGRDGYCAHTAALASAKRHVARRRDTPRAEFAVMTQSFRI